MANPIVVGTPINWSTFIVWSTQVGRSFDGRCHFGYSTGPFGEVLPSGSTNGQGVPFNGVDRSTNALVWVWDDRLAGEVSPFA